jgi:polysaccharide chain length determinant protein (PEP-CTERM system associated)
LEQTRESLREARLLLEEMTHRRDALDAQLRGDGSAGSAAAVAGIVTPTDARIQQMRITLDNLLARYTDKHPQVRQLRGLIEELEVQRDEEREAIMQGGVAAASGGAASSQFLDLRALKAEADGGVAELTVRVKEYERRAEALGGKVNQIPEVEAQLKQLDRDYAVVQGQHEQLMKRRESARISEDVETNASDVTFRVIDPPFVPIEPSEPDKVMLNLAVLVLALGAGVGVALLRSLLHPVVVDARMLAQSTTLPLLGVVTQNKTKAEQRKDYWGLAGFATCNVLLLLGLAGAIYGPGMLPL